MSGSSNSATHGDAIALLVSQAAQQFGIPAPWIDAVIRVESGGGQIALEVWEISAEAFGTFVAAIPPPLGIGTIELEDGERVKGFLCESYALAGATDITHFGGWLNFLKGK